MASILRKLELAIEAKSLKRFKALVDADPSLAFAPMFEGSKDTPLHYAAWQDAGDIVSYLIQLGADLNARGDKGFTPLHYCAYEGCLDSARLLIDAGADLNVKDDTGMTAALLGAYGREEQSVQVAELLDEAGADIDLNTLICLGQVSRARELIAQNPNLSEIALLPRNLINDAVIMISVKISETEHASDDPGRREEALEMYQDALKCLVEAGVDINEGTEADFPPLFNAVQSQQPGLVRLVLELGADVQYVSAGGDTAYMWVGEGPGVDEVKAILSEYGLEPDPEDSDELELDLDFDDDEGPDFHENLEAADDDLFTPLHVAAFSESPDATRMLLEAGADVHAKDENGLTPLVYAARGIFPEKQEVVELLIAAGSELDLNSLVALGEVEKVSEILERDPQAWRKAPQPQALMQDAISLLIGRLKSVEDEDNSQQLQEDILAKYKPLVTLLIKTGVSLDELSEFGYPPLFDAIQHNLPALVRFLLEQGADVHQELEEGETAVDFIEEDPEFDEVKAVLGEYGLSV